MAAQYDLTINKNETFSLYVEYMDETNTLVNFIGPTASNPIYYSKMMIKRYKKDTEALVLLKSYPYEILCGTTAAGPSGGIQLNRNSTNTGGQTGGILIDMNAYATMNALVPEKVFYDLFVVKTPNGVTAGLTGSVSTKLLEGAINVVQAVTTNIEDQFAQFTFDDEIDGGAFP